MDKDIRITGDQIILSEGKITEEEEAVWNSNFSMEEIVRAMKKLKEDKAVGKDDGRVLRKSDMTNTWRMDGGS